MRLSYKKVRFVSNAMCVGTTTLLVSVALIAGINGVEGITIPYAIQIVQVIAVVQGVIGTYLLGEKAVRTINKGE